MALLDITSSMMRYIRAVRGFGRDVRVPRGAVTVLTGAVRVLGGAVRVPGINDSVLGVALSVLGVTGELPITLTRPDRSVIQQEKTPVSTFGLTF
jgi:hypothetical protein